MNKLSTRPRLHHPTLFGILLGSTVAAAAQTAGAADLSVCRTGCSYTTIQSSIDNSRSGDVIHIAAGTYFENILIEGKRLTLVGAGADQTEINGRDRAAAVTLGTVDVEAPKTVSIIGVTITHGSGPDGGGIIVRGAVLDLQNSIVASNRSGGSGGGIAIDTFGLFVSTITRSMIVHNRAAGAGGGINVGAEARVQITNSTVARNTAGTRGGGLRGEGASSTTIQTTTFSDNTAHDSGGAIYLEGGLPKASMTISGSSLVDNAASLDGGAVVEAGHLAISSTVIAHNTAGRNGGGLLGGLSLSDVFVVQNRAGGQGGGVYNGSLVTLTNSTIADNVPNNCVDGGGTGCP